MPARKKRKKNVRKPPPEMQPELPIIDKRGAIERTKKNAAGEQEAANPTKYATWEDIVEGISPRVKLPVRQAIEKK